MKKMLSVIAAVVLAVGFIGCSDDSEDNSALMLALVSDSGSSASLPASVGTNELVGKKFYLSENSWEFNDSTYKLSNTLECDAGTYNSACKCVTETTCSYSYNATTKRIYSKTIGSTVYIVRDDKKTVIPELSFSTDAQYVEVIKKQEKIIYDKADESYLDSLVKVARFYAFTTYGYTDSTGETAVSNEIIARYNRARALSDKSVSCEAYSLSSTGLKLVTDNTYYPKGTKLSDFLLSFASNSLNVVNNSSIFSTFNYRMQYVWPERYCALTYSNNLLGCFVSSVSETAINASKLGHRTSSDSDYEFNNTGSSLKLEKTETESQAVYKVYGIGPDSEDGSESLLGTITIPYATSSNIPDFSSEEEHALVQ